MPLPALTSRLTVVLFTDLVGSTDLKSRIGTPAYLALIVRHDALFKQAMLAHGGQGAEVVDRAGDSHFAVFPSASAAVRTALAFHQSIGAEPWEHGPIQARVGIHQGELGETVGEDGQRKVAGLAVDLGSRIMSLGSGNQTLLTRQAFDDARNFVQDASLAWLAHGPYLFKGNDDPLDVYEVGLPGVAPLSPPPDAEKAKRIEGEAHRPPRRRTDARLASRHRPRHPQQTRLVARPQVQSFAGHDGRVRGSAFRPDGKVVITVSDDRTLKLSNSDTGRELRTLLGA